MPLRTLGISHDLSLSSEISHLLSWTSENRFNDISFWRGKWRYVCSPSGYAISVPRPNMSYGLFYDMPWYPYSESKTLLFLIKVTNGITWDKLLFLCLPVAEYIFAQDAIVSLTLFCSKYFNGMQTLQTDHVWLMSHGSPNTMIRWLRMQCTQLGKWILCLILYEIRNMGSIARTQDTFWRCSLAKYIVILYGKTPWPPLEIISMDFEQVLKYVIST